MAWRLPKLTSRLPGLWGYGCNARVPGRITLLGRKHNHDRTHLDAIVEVDHVLVGHPDAAGRDGLADILGLVGAVNPEQRVLVPLVEIDTPCTQWVVGPTFHIVRQ